jgi:hypothetical protein
MNAARREAPGGTPAPQTEVDEEDGMAKKLIMLSLEALLTECREQKVAIVWVAPVTTPEWYRQDPGLPRLTSRVLVTATALESGRLIEWRYWVGRALAEVSEGGLRPPPWLRRKADEALSAITKCVDDGGFEVREGLLASDTVTVDTFRL